MDIISSGSWPSYCLSNFAGHQFVFQGMHCFSMEGLLQSFKAPDTQVQYALCRLVGYDAQYAGRRYSALWQSTQTLWWKSVPYERGGVAYAQLLTSAYDALCLCSPCFRNALAATKREVLAHSVGKSNPRQTVLTAAEFCNQLNRLRTQLGQGDS